MNRLILGLSILLFCGCIDPEANIGTRESPESVQLNGDEILIKGRVQYAEIEGGFYYIAGEDGQNYDPINLEDEFKHVGIDVAFIAIVREDLASFHMFGVIIEIVRAAR
ncbi:hypothetical protein F9K33_14725 [bacterium]|nr:MAG: hypothetical protein F9K33_14725 [bacterium]